MFKSFKPPQALSLPLCNEGLQEVSSIAITLGNLMTPPSFHQTQKRSQDQQQLTRASALTEDRPTAAKTEKKHRLVAGKSPVTKLFPYSSSPQKSEGVATASAGPRPCGAPVSGIWRLALAVQVSRVTLPWMPTERPHWTHHQKSFPPSPAQFKGHC